MPQGGQVSLRVRLRHSRKFRAFARLLFFSARARLIQCAMHSIPSRPVGGSSDSDSTEQHRGRGEFNGSLVARPSWHAVLTAHRTRSASERRGVGPLGRGPRLMH